MRIELNNPKVKFYIGDVRDRDSVDNVMEGVDLVFHAAALKQVPSCEFFPMQAVLTNIIGGHNVIESAIQLRRFERCMPEHRQGRISRQCNGYDKIADGKGRSGGRTCQNHQKYGCFLCPIRQCYVLSRLGNTSFRSADKAE